MSDDKSPVDTGDLEQAKSGLSHVETKEHASSVKPIFKCQSCDHSENIPDSILEKMENDEDISGSIPSHHDQQMKISVVE